MSLIYDCNCCAGGDRVCPARVDWVISRRLFSLMHAYTVFIIHYTIRGIVVVVSLYQQSNFLVFTTLSHFLSLVDSVGTPEF